MLMITGGEGVAGVREDVSEPRIGRTYNQSYGELARLIGEPRPPVWAGARITAGWLLALQALDLLLWLWRQLEADRSLGSMIMIAVLLTLALAVTGILTLVWLGLFIGIWGRQQKEDEREERLLRIVEEQPEFLAYYQGTRWVRLNDGPKKESIDIAQSIGKPIPVHWGRAWVAAWSVPACLVLGFTAIEMGVSSAGASGGPLIGEYVGGVLWAVGLVAVGVWLWLSGRVEKELRQEETRRLRLVKAVVSDPKFPRFYEDWCKSLGG